MVTVMISTILKNVDGMGVIVVAQHVLAVIMIAEQTLIGQHVIRNV